MLDDAYLTRNLVESFLENIRLEKRSKIQKDFEEILSKDWTLGKEAIRKIYELGEIFETKEARSYVNQINKILYKKPKNLFLRVIRQEIAYNSDEYEIEDLIRINNKDLEIFPESPYLINFKGLIFWNLDEYDKAIRYIDQALELDKDNVDFLNNKARVYIDDGRFRKAEQIMQRALGLEPKYSELKTTREYIGLRNEQDIYKKSINTIKKTIDKQEKSIKNIKFEFIQIFALFVVILTVVVKMVSFNYENFKSISFPNIIFYQLAINSSWLFALVLMLALIIVLHVKKNK